MLALQEAPAATVPMSRPDTRKLALARRRRTVRIMKYVLPFVGLALLSSIAVWPEISRTIARGRATLHDLTALRAAGVMKLPRYRGYDQQNQPYMISADTATRVGDQRYNLVNPRGDITLHNGTWLQVQSKSGVYVEGVDQLDLTHNVTLYREDGTIMTSAVATMDMKQGAVMSGKYTHAEGPFGTLDADGGFSLFDKGNIVQFHGPARLVLNGSH